MLLAVEKILVPAPGYPARPRAEEAQRLSIAVISTSIESTIAAMKKAGAFASSLGARITLVVPQVVPFPLPLESPPVLVEFNENRYRAIASESPVETTVRIYLCRDRLETLKLVLHAGCLVVIGGRRHWWPTQEKSLARQLRRAGHEVIFTETE